MVGCREGLRKGEVNKVKCSVRFLTSKGIIDYAKPDSSVYGATRNKIWAHLCMSYCLVMSLMALEYPRKIHDSIQRTHNFYEMSFNLNKMPIFALLALVRSDTKSFAFYGTRKSFNWVLSASLTLCVYVNKGRMEMYSNQWEMRVEECLKRTNYDDIVEAESIQNRFIEISFRFTRRSKKNSMKTHRNR